MSAVTASVKVEQRLGQTDGGNDKFSYRVIAAQNTTKPRLGTEMSEKQLDSFFAAHPSIRVNIVLA